MLHTFLLVVPYELPSDRHCTRTERACVVEWLRSLLEFISGESASTSAHLVFLRVPGVACTACSGGAPAYRPQRLSMSQ
jgi:hypothetical protein